MKRNRMMNHSAVKRVALGLGFLLSSGAFANNTATVCEVVNEGRFACDTFALTDGVSLVSQDWQVISGMIITNQDVGTMVARCATGHNDGIYQFDAVLSNGHHFSYRGEIDCTEAPQEVPEIPPRPPRPCQGDSCEETNPQ